MTEQQRTARIEFVKKLLVANGFEEITNYPMIRHSKKSVSIGQMRTIITIGFTQIEAYRLLEIIPHDQPLKPLRDFIKLSNQK